MGALSAVEATAGTSTSIPLLAGDQGTEQTLELIRSAYHEGLSDSLVRSVAGAIASKFPPNDLEGVARAIFGWVSNHIRFVRDPIGHETVSSARWTLTHGFGDCDDFAVLLPTLLSAVGIPARVVTVALDPSDPSAFTHIYPEALIGNRWIPVDAARPNASFGKPPSNGYRKRIWYFDPPEHFDLQGLAGCDCGTRRELGFDWDIFSHILQEGGQVAGNIITHLRAPPHLLPYIQTGGSTPTETTSPVPGSPGITAGFTTTQLMMGGFAILLLVLKR